MELPRELTPQRKEPLDQLAFIPEQANIRPFENLVSRIPKKRIKELEAMVESGYRTDLESRGEWVRRHKTWLKLYAQQRDPKSFPWPKSSNVGVPMLAMAVVQYQARAIEALIPARAIVKGDPIGKEQSDKAKAERTSDYLNYQLMYKFSEFKKSMDTSLYKLAIEGTLIRKSFYDANKKRIVSDFISPTDFVVHYSTRWLEDSERYTQQQWLTVNEIKINQRNKVYVDTEVDFEAGDSSTLDETKQQALKNVGLEVSGSTDDPLAKRLILEQHVYLDLTGKSGIKSPYIVTMDFLTQTILRIVSRKNPKTGEVMNFFTPYVFIPNPDGFYGYGFGLLLEHLNEASNTILNQLIDAGTLDNLQTGFVSKRIGMKRGEIQMSPGKFQEVDIKSDDIRKSVFPFNFTPPSSTLLVLLGNLQTYADRLTTVTEAQTGEMPKSDTAATSIVALLEQGLKFFSASHKRNHDSFQSELEKIYKLNDIYLDVEEYFDIVMNKESLINPETGELDVEMGAMLEELKKDWTSPKDVRLVSDANITSRQEKITKAQFVYQTILENPLTAQNPVAIKEALTGFLVAMDIDDATIEKLMQEPPAPEPPPPPPDLPPEEENRLFLNDGQIQALEGQNHSEHLKSHEEFESGEFFLDITPQGKTNFEAHKREHLGFLYLIGVASQTLGDVPQEQAV